MLTFFDRFRWAVCQLDSLSKCLKRDKLRNALQSLPTGLYETYDRIMYSIDEDYIEDVFKILQWLVHSTRPLDLAEVAEVVAVGLDNETGFDPESRLRESLEVLTICSSLVTTVARRNSEYDGHIYREPEVRLAHFSVKEYLVNARIQREDTTYTIEKDDQGLVAQTCLTYLLYFKEPAMLTPSYVDDFPLAEYAANYWFVHARAAKRDIDKINKLGFKLCQSRGTFLNWIRLRDLDGYGLGNHDLSNRAVDRFNIAEHLVPLLYTMPFAPPLYYAALAGLVGLSKFLLENGADVNAEGGQYGYALQAASVVAYPSVVGLLLDHGAVVNAQGGNHCTALHAACYEGHEDTVRLLLHHGADVSIQNWNRNTALQVACNEKQEAVIKVMSEIRPDLMHQRLAYELREAALKGQLTVVKKLLEDGAKVDAEGGTYKSALQAASYNGHEPVVKLLLENGANANTKGGEYGSPLRAASYKGHESIVKVLLENRADANFQDDKNNTALQVASYHGHESVVKLLLGNGADVNPKCGKYASALQVASYHGHEVVVKLLLGNGADVNHRGGKNDSALQGASYNGHERIVRLLLETGADVNHNGGKYGSALQGASYNGHEPVVRLLLENGADVNIKGADNDTPLQAASIRGHVAIARLLLENGADIDAQGGESGSSLHAAASEGNEALVKLLVENGADINICIPTGLYPTALAAAAFAGSEPIVNLLLERGIDIGYCSEAIMSVARGVTMLPYKQHESSWCNIVKLMHDKGAKFTLQTFLAVCRTGSESLIKLMFEIGLDFTPDVDCYKQALAKFEGGLEFGFIVNEHTEIFDPGHKAFMKLLQEKMASLSG